MSYIPEPDVVYRPILESLSAGKTPVEEALPPSVKNVRMSLNDVFIKKNRAFGRAEIYVASVVTDDISEEPIVTSIKTFENVKNNEALPLGPSGVAMYRNPVEGKIPRFIDYRILIMESDEGVRQAGTVLEEIRSDSEYKSVSGKLKAAIAAGNPTAALAMEIGGVVLGIVARVLKMNRDDQIIYVAGSFDNAFENLGVNHGVVVQDTKFATISYQVMAV
ncbi:MAG: hypothetical protein CMO55_12145 [Verrucomicrobiales bacterium]|nr:hypothetical protein [Verrucomicrobiales bacterium]